MRSDIDYPTIRRLPRSSFADTVGGAKASANLYSLIETCKANRIDTYRHLIDLFKALPHANSADDYAALLPWDLGMPEEPQEV